ncbi:hypothetical protein CM19_03935 [Candidatus Acidianus copahuensis]|uniref:ArnR1-like winged helix-turn-helix domain-containing protein n=1 Tax=Candidatus Acidianus copahuensis TaxID=1160895 RepID=A0A031LU06_9CREN|nr:winged helix-turn-helix domain-containing protein [Candidatus Acidianus copahuensis]EZQ10588.1 hypothetical protein CM19_03935 [Candidatus Acidianus copahuensis]
MDRFDGYSTLEIYLKHRKKRTQLEILLEVVMCSNNQSITRIMYCAGLSYPLVKKYLGTASENGLVEFNGKTYLLTEKGKSLLKAYSDFSRLVKEVKVIENNINSLLNKI